MKSGKLLSTWYDNFYFFSATLFVYVPILFLIAYSFNSGISPASWESFSLCWYEELFSSHWMLVSIFNSLFVATMATVISIFLATLMVISSRWMKGSGNWIFNFFMLNSCVPEIVLAVCVLTFFVVMRMKMGYLSLIAGHTLLGLGFAIPNMRSAFLELDNSITEASVDLGANLPQTFFYVIIPLLRPTMIATAFTIFTVSLDDFFVSFFCTGPEIQTISTFVFTKIRSVANPSLNALSTCLFLMSSALVFVLWITRSAERVFSDE